MTRSDGGTPISRRRFMQFSGAAIGGAMAGSTVVAAESEDRFIVETAGNDGLGDVEVVHEMPGVDMAVVEGSEQDVDSAPGVSDYAADVEVHLEDPDANDAAPTVDESSAADEPGYGIQWDKQALDVPTAHETTKGEGTRITVIDTGVPSSHPDLDVNEELSRDFTGDGYGAANAAGGYHGSHVAGIAAAGDNGLGVLGMAPEAELVDCRVFSPTVPATFGGVLAAVVYSANVDADVANLSLGAYPIPRQAIGQFYGKALNRVMTYANAEGTLLVIAAGNDAADLQHDKNWISLPNEGAQGMSIAATGPIGFGWGDEGLESPPESPAFYTNYGTNAIDLGAPGGDADLQAAADDVPGWYLDLVFSTLSIPQFDGGEYQGSYDTYAWLAGTSMAAPQVAGAAALVKSEHPDYNANQVESALEEAAEVPDEYDRTYYGSGFLNVVDAL